jgi:SAM-dependent methyltransferase
VALVLPHSIFFHVGRTAGHYVRKTIREMAIPAYDVGSFHDWPSNIQLNETEKKKLFFCFVRHPLAWLKSFWCHEMQFGWSQCEYSHKTQSDSFAEFLTKAVEAFPNGPASEVFRPFLMQCQQVGRQENLTADLRRILERAGEKVVPEVLEQAGVTTVEIAREILDAATAPKELLERVLHTERELCERFGYVDIPKSLIGPSNVCLATYVPLGESKQPLNLDAVAFQDIENAFTLGGKCFRGPKSRRRSTMAIRQAMKGIDFRDKHVIDVGCMDGVFCFHAESQGATRVVGVDPAPRDILARLKQACNSSAEFISHGVYGAEQAVSGRFDVVFCLRWLQMARYPLLLIRTLSRLMKQGGRLVLNTDYLDCYPGVPLIYTPVGSEAPINSYSCTYFNKEGLLNALACYGFHDFVIHAELEQGIDASRDFARMPFPKRGVLHASESLTGNITLSCTWSPASADTDPRYASDRVTSQLLVDFWDQQLPAGGIVTHQVDEELLAHLRDRFHVFYAESKRLTEELNTARATVHDRDKDLHDTRRDLVERTDDLVATRQLLNHRTNELVAARKRLAESSNELVATRQSLAERTDDLVATRQSLAERTNELVATRQSLIKRTDELVATRQSLVERTDDLLSTRQSLVKRTDALVATRQSLVKRTDELAAKQQSLVERTDDLVATRTCLAECTDNLVTMRQSLVETTEDLVATRQVLIERTEDLVATRNHLIERTERLEKMVAQVEILSNELAEAKARSATAEPTTDSPETTPPTP